jgi:hypothetical protein
LFAFAAAKQYGRECGRGRLVELCSMRGLAPI